MAKWSSLHTIGGRFAWRFMCETVAVFKEKSFSIHCTIAEYYWHDARDFLSRFDVLWDIETNKSGRIKSFVDLLMGCECALKSHVMLGLVDKDPKEAYSILRKAGHRISDLVDSAVLKKNRSIYDFLKKELAGFSVDIRYSLDAYDTFFPMLSNWSDARLSHTTTIGSQLWMMSIRAALHRLIEDINPHFTGLVSNDLESIIKNEEEVKSLIMSFRR